MTLLKRAFRKMALRHHPDKGGDAETFMEVHEAYEELLKVCGTAFVIITFRVGFTVLSLFPGGFVRFWVFFAPGS